MQSKYSYTKLACYAGFVVQAIINNFLPILFVALQDIYSLGYEKLARLIVVNFVTQMITDIFAPKILKHLGIRKAAFLSQATAAAGLALLGILPKIFPNAYSSIIVAVMVYAFGSGLMEVILSPMIEALPTENKSGNMAFLHSFYCWGQAFTIIVTTVLVKWLGFAGWNFIPLVWAIIPLLNAFSFLKVPVIEPCSDKKMASFPKLFKRGNFKGYMLMMLCAGASEIAMSQWASLFAQKALGVTKVMGDLAGPCAFAIFMAIGRIFYSAVSKKVSFKKVVICLSAFTILCYITVALSASATVSLIFCAVCGLSVSVFWPGLYSAGARDFSDGGMIMYSVFAMCGDIGCALGPWILGITADNLGLNFGFGATAVFPLLLLVTAIFTFKNNDCKTSKQSV